MLELEFKVLDALPAHICVLNKSGKITYFNRAWHQFGLENGLDIGDHNALLNYLDVLKRSGTGGDQDALMVLQGIQAVLSGNRADFQHEYPCHSPTEQRWFYMVVKPIDSGAGVVIMHHDITQRKLVEQALVHNETFLRQILDNDPECVKVLTPEGMILSMNAAGLDTLGLTSVEPVIGRSILELILPKYVHSVETLLKDVVNGRQRQLKFEIKSPDNDRRWMESKVVPIKDSEGRVTALLAVTRDITETIRATEAIRNSEEKYRQLVEQAQDVIFTLSFDGHITSVNPSFERLTGYSTSHWIGKKFDPLVHPADLPQVHRAVREIIETNNSVSASFRILHRDGSYRHFDFDGGQLTVNAKEPQILGTARDATARVHAEMKIRESEQRYRTLFEQHITGNFISTPEGSLIACNKVFCDIFGFESEAEALNSQMPDLYVNPRDRSNMLASLRKFGKLENFETTLKRTDGRLIHTIENVFGRFDESGRLIEINGFLMDLSAQKEMEKKTQHQDLYLNAAQDVIVVRDLENRVQFWNKSAEREYGWSANEVIGNDVNEWLFPDTPDKIIEVLKQVLTDGRWLGELEVKTKSGEKIVMLSRMSLIRDDKGRPVSILSINTNITERKRLEDQFLRAQRLESVGTLASGIAHDLNNILNTIMLANHVVKRRSTGKYDDILETIEDSVNRGSDIVKQVLLFTRGSSGDLGPVDFKKLLVEMSRIVRETFPKSVKLDVDIAEDLMPLLGNATQIHQILMNLTVNARDALGPGGGAISIKAENRSLDESYVLMRPELPPGQYVSVQVRDNGPGIPKEMHKKVFEPFFTTKDPGSGTGLGLSTVQKIVKEHGGNITLQSRPGKGTTFQILLPAACIEAANLQTTATEEMIGNNELILVVDDELSICRIAERILIDHGYRVLTAGDGAEAVARFAQHSDISAVVLDMMMPIMDGPATARALARIDENVVIIGMTGLRESLPPELGNIRTVLDKPFTGDDLLRVLKKFVRKK